MKVVACTLHWLAWSKGQDAMPEVSLAFCIIPAFALRSRTTDALTPPAGTLLLSKAVEGNYLSMNSTLNQLKNRVLAGTVPLSRARDRGCPRTKPMISPS